MHFQLARLLGWSASVALALCVSSPAQAGCYLQKSLCDDRCNHSAFGGMSGGIIGGLELGSCENSCTNKYHVCMKGHDAYSPDTIGRDKEADKAFDAQLSKNAKLAALQQRKIASDRDAAEQAELQLLLAWHVQFPDPGTDGLSEFKPGQIAVVTSAAPLRRNFPSPNFGAGSAYDDDALDPSRTRVSDKRYPFIDLLRTGARVEIVYGSDNGAISIKQIDGEYPGRTGQVVAGALRLVAPR